MAAPLLLTHSSLGNGFLATVLEGHVVAPLRSANHATGLLIIFNAHNRQEVCCRISNGQLDRQCCWLC